MFRQTASNSRPSPKPLVKRASHAHSKSSSRLVDLQIAADASVQVCNLSELQHRATGSITAPNRAKVDLTSHDETQGEVDPSQLASMTGGFVSASSEGIEAGLSMGPERQRDASRNTVYQLRRAAFSAALRPGLQPYQGATRPNRRSGLRGSSILTQQKPVDVIQREEDGEGQRGRLANYLGDISEYGAVANGFKKAGMVSAGLTASALAIEAALWWINNYFGVGPSGKNTIIPPILGLAAQLSYFMKNYAVGSKSTEVVAQKIDQLVQISSQYHKALSGENSAEYRLKAGSKIRGQGQKVYEELAALHTTHKATMVRLYTSGAGVVLAITTLAAFFVEHASWSTGFGPDLSTILTLLTAFAPLVQKQLDKWAEDSPELPSNPFEPELEETFDKVNQRRNIDESSSFDSEGSSFDSESGRSDDRTIPSNPVRGSSENKISNFAKPKIKDKNEGPSNFWAPEKMRSSFPV